MSVPAVGLIKQFSNIKQYSDTELIAQIFLQSGQSIKQLEEIWQEFITRFEYLLVKAIRLAYHQHAPQLQLMPEDVCQLEERIFLKLSERRYQDLFEQKYYAENRLESYLRRLAYGVTLDYLALSSML
ncbi:MAG: hypothetical protein AB1489_17775 [Acidobacteriota bacterium]